MKGGGTDDTAALQSILNRAKGDHPLHLIIDGAVLIAGVDVFGNTTIECTNGGGLYLRDRSARAIIRNAHRSRAGITDEHIEIRGCFLNGNRDNQPTANIARPDLPGFPWPSNKEEDGSYMAGLQILGVNYFTLYDTTLWNIRAFGLMLANAKFVDIHNVTVDHGGGPTAPLAKYAVTDGLHLKGPLHNVSIDTVKFRVGDDAIAINANDYETDDITARNDFGPYVGQGSITDVDINNVTFLPGQVSGVRILSTNERIDRIRITGIHGFLRYEAINIGHWVNRKSLGNIGSVSIDNVDVQRQFPPPEEADLPDWIPLNLKNSFPLDCLMAIDGKLERLTIHRLAAVTDDYEQIFDVRPDATVGEMDLDITARGHSSSKALFQLERRAKIDQLRLAVDWHGPIVDEGLASFAGDPDTIQRLQWVNSPPMYLTSSVRGEWLDVTFSEEVKASDFTAGSEVRINGRPIRVKTAFRDNSRRIVRYVLSRRIKSRDKITWSYNSAYGNILNLNGDQLMAVSEKHPHGEITE